MGSLRPCYGPSSLPLQAHPSHKTLFLFTLHPELRLTLYPKLSGMRRRLTNLSAPYNLTLTLLSG